MATKKQELIRNLTQTISRESKKIVEAIKSSLKNYKSY